MILVQRKEHEDIEALGLKSLLISFFKNQVPLKQLWCLKIIKEEITMKTKQTNEILKQAFLSADDVAALLYISKSSAYREIRRMNELLQAQGYLIVSGRVPKKFFEEKYYVS